MSSDTKPATNCFRKALQAAVCAVLQEDGFGTVEKAALETLTEMLQAYMVELARSAKTYCEHAGRVEVMLTDVSMALIEMGMDIESIGPFAKKPIKPIHAPSVSAPTATPKPLVVGEKKSKPAHIPDHLPSFPDPHTYIRSLTHKAPINEYQVMREKRATQKRDVERALTKYIAKTGNTVSLFDESPPTFPLIAATTSSMPYIDAQLPKDQDLDSQELREVGGSEQDGMAAGASDGALDLPRDQNPESPDSNAIDNPYMRLPRRLTKRKKMG